MNQFTVEYHYQKLLAQLGHSEENMHPEQKKQLKEVYYGAFGQILVMLREDITAFDKDEAIIILQEFVDQIHYFFEEATK